MSTQRHADAEMHTPLLDVEHVFTTKVKSAWQGFQDFALRENVLEVAVGLIIAAAFTKVVNSLVADIILPVISLLPMMSKRLDEKFIVLRRGPHYTKPNGYNTRQQGIADGAVLWTYGAFLDEVLAFFGLGISLYIIGMLYGYFTKESIIIHTFKCPYDYACRLNVARCARRG